MDILCPVEQLVVQISGRSFEKKEIVYYFKVSSGHNLQTVIAAQIIEGDQEPAEVKIIDVDREAAAAAEVQIIEVDQTAAEVQIIEVDQTPAEVQIIEVDQDQTEVRIMDVEVTVIQVIVVDQTPAEVQTTSVDQEPAETRIIVGGQEITEVQTIAGDQQIATGMQIVMVMGKMSFQRQTQVSNGCFVSLCLFRIQVDWSTLISRSVGSIVLSCGILPLI